MNGEPLAPEHGFPVRAVAPGYIGARSVKWLAEIGGEPRGQAACFGGPGGSSPLTIVMGSMRRIFAPALISFALMTSSSYFVSALIVAVTRYLHSTFLAIFLSPKKSRLA